MQSSCISRECAVFKAFGISPHTLYWSVSSYVLFVGLCECASHYHIGDVITFPLCRVWMLCKNLSEPSRALPWMCCVQGLGKPHLCSPVNFVRAQLSVLSGFFELLGDEEGVRNRRLSRKKQRLKNCEKKLWHWTQFQSLVMHIVFMAFSPTFTVISLCLY